MSIVENIKLGWTVVTGPLRWRREVNEEFVADLLARGGLWKYLPLPMIVTFEAATEVMKRESERAIRIAFKLPPDATQEEVYTAVRDEDAKFYGYASAAERDAEQAKRQEESDAEYIRRYGPPSEPSILDKFKFGAMRALFYPLAVFNRNLERLDTELVGLPEGAGTAETEIAYRAIEGVLAREYYKLGYDATDEQLEEAKLKERSK